VVSSCPLKRVEFAREFVQGADLAKLLGERGKIGVQRCQEIVVQLARHLCDLQKLGICHGNLTPSNIISRVGAVRIVDCSLGCSVAKRVSTMGEDASFVNYLAPELIESPGKLSIFSDMYALGCIWFEMLTGAPPFPDGSQSIRLTSHAKLEPQWSRLHAAGADSATIDAIRQLLAKSPDKRFASTDELRSTLSSQDVQGAFIECESCEKRYRIKPALSGKSVRCKQCGSSISIPNQM
jgi:serine/threonine protein kinase